MKISISPLMIPLAAAAVLTHSARQLSLAYGFIALHELAHLLAAVCIGLRAEEISLSPFGAHLKLKNKIVRSISDEIILYAAGPLANGVMALAGAYFNNAAMYRINIALMVMNLLPISPLDGGVILKRMLSENFGIQTAERICAAISIAAGSLFLAASVYGLYIGRMNWSMFVMSVFLLGSAATGRELYNTELISGTAHKKRSNRARLVVVENNGDILKALRQISPAHTVVAVTKDKDGKIILIDEKELLKSVR